MSNAQHTRGPWRISRDSKRIIVDEYGNKVAEAATGRNLVDGTPEVNSRLIAAAPCMLNLLRRIRAADEAALTELLKMNIPTDSLDYGFRKEIAELLREIDRA